MSRRTRRRSYRRIRRHRGLRLLAGLVAAVVLGLCLAGTLAGVVPPGVIGFGFVVLVVAAVARS